MEYTNINILSRVKLLRSTRRDSHFAFHIRGGKFQVRRAGNVELAALVSRAHCDRLQRSCTPSEFRFQIADCVF